MCDEAWAVVVGRFPSNQRQIEEAVVRLAAGADCHPDPCEDQLYVAIDYIDGDGIRALLVRGQGGHLKIDQASMCIVN